MRALRTHTAVRLEPVERSSRAGTSTENKPSNNQGKPLGEMSIVGPSPYLGFEKVCGWLSGP